MTRCSLFLLIAVVAIGVSGCAITDYDGHPSHKTTGEAKLWGQEIAFSGFGADVDGTYSYTVKYNTTPGVGADRVSILSYRNPVVGSFSRDGQIDRDGDDVQGSSGILGGKFNNAYVSVDTAPGCQFGDNLTQVKIGPPAAFLCVAGAIEEIDADFELGEAFASLDDLFGQIWSGALQGDFTLHLTSIRFDGVSHDLLPGVEILAAAGTNRPVRYRITNGPGVQDLVTVILNNTESMTPVSIGFGFEGGLSVDLPANMKFAFDHQALAAL